MEIEIQKTETENRKQLEWKKEQKIEYKIEEKEDPGTETFTNNINYFQMSSIDYY